MRREQIEFSVASIAARRARNRRRAMSQVYAPIQDTARRAAVAPEAVDEAFAASDGPPSHQSLIKNLSAQLAALDRQRKQLADLLRSIDADAIAESRE